MKSLAFVGITLLTAVNAASVTFKIIAPDAKEDVQVNIDGQLTTLKATDPDVPYYTGSADLADGATYKYVVDGTAEKFNRTLASGSSTRNEFYNRPVTYATNIPELPSILANGSWTRGSTDSPLWDSNYLTSIFVTGNEDEMENLIENVPTTTYKAKITFIGPDDITTFEDCTFGLHRPGRKNNDAKQSWVWSLPEGELFAERSWFKIRHQEEDPTQLREMLYADILRNMGAYGNEANMVRFFINKEGMGTFNLLDDVIMYSYINAMFYNGSAPQKMGALYNGGSGATFNPADGYDSFTPNVESPLGQDAIAPFAEAFAAVDFKNNAEVQAIAEYFDYDQFLRFMVIEFLTGDWDGYWMEQTNNGAYIDTNDNNKMYYLGQDFDATFGVNLAYDKSFVDVPYTDFPTKFPNGFLINNLLQNPNVKATFQSYLTTTVEQLFNNATLGPYAIARHKFIYHDLVWDRSIKQRSPGNIFGWTASQTTENLYEGVTAPGIKTGGAEWGLLEWISAKEKAVKSNLKISEKAAAGELVADEQEEQNVEEEEKKEDNDVEEEEQQKDNDVKENANISAASFNTAAGESAAGKMVPQILSAMAVAGAVAALL